MMTRCLFSSLTRRFVWRIPLLVYAASWTVFLTITVAVVSFAPEIAFMWAISPPSSATDFSRRCKMQGAVMVPLDLPAEVFCFPAKVFGMSKIDLVVPPVFAAVVVAGSAVVVRTMGLWESEEAH